VFGDSLNIDCWTINIHHQMTGSLPCSCSCLSESLHIAPLHIALKITEMGEGEITEIGKGEKRDGKDFNA